MSKPPELERKPGEYMVPGLNPCGPMARYLEKVIRWCRENDWQSCAESLAPWLPYASLYAGASDHLSAGHMSGGDKK